MSRIALVRVTFGSAEEAATVSRELIDELLAACVNIEAPCQAIYRWQGAIEDATEVAALFKTRETLVEALVERLADLHSYDLPAIEHWLAETSGEVADWIASETLEQPLFRP